MKVNIFLLMFFFVAELSALSRVSENIDGLIAYDGFSGSAYGWLDVWSESEVDIRSNIYEGFFSYSSDELVMEYNNSGILVKGGRENLKVSGSDLGTHPKVLVRKPVASGAFEETFYVSFLVQLSDQPQSEYDFVAVGTVHDMNDAGVALGSYGNSNSLGACYARNGLLKSYISSGLAQSDITYFIAAKFVVNEYGVVKEIISFVNPTSSILERAEWTDTVSDVYVNMESVALQAFFHSDAYIDEIRLGKTWNSVVSSLDNSAEVNNSERKVTRFIGPYGSWKDPSKWTNGIPNIDIDTAIIAGACLVDEEVRAKNVVVLPSAKLLVTEGGEINSDHPIVLKAERSAVAEFLQDTSVVAHNLDKEYYFYGGQWNFICVPDTIEVDQLFPNLKLAEYWLDPDADYWVLEFAQELRALGDDAMREIYDKSYLLQAGRGYMVWPNVDHIRTFGITTDKYLMSISTTNTTSNVPIDLSGWNLMGNPYAHSIRYEDIFDSCQHNQDYYTGTVYVWDGLSYKVCAKGVGNDLKIKPMQAFFVKRLSNNPDSKHFCMIENGGQLSSIVSPVPAQKHEAKNTLAIGVNLFKGENSDNTYITIESEASSGYDEYDDAFKIFSDRNDYPDQDFIYTDLLSNKYAINALSFENQFLEVPISLDLAQNLDSLMLSFSFDDDSSYVYTLVDDYEMTMTPIENGGILMLPTKNEKLIEGRFSVFVTEATGNQLSLPDELGFVNYLGDVVSSSSGLNVYSKSPSDLNVIVFDFSGKVYRKSTVRPGADVEFLLDKGVYLLRLSDGQKSDVKKVVIL